MNDDISYMTDMLFTILLVLISLLHFLNATECELNNSRLCLIKQITPVI